MPRPLLTIRATRNRGRRTNRLPQSPCRWQTAIPRRLTRQWGLCLLGIVFDTGTRVLSGTPTALGSGTITIRATNSEGMADWTVDYTTVAAATAPARPAAPTLTVDDHDSITAVGVDPDDGGAPITSYNWRYRVNTPGQPWVNRNGETSLTQVLDGSRSWLRNTESNFRQSTARVLANDHRRAFATTAAALASPSFTDPTGDAQTWMVGDAITDITVPAANGNPTPTYAVEGSLPVGIAFNTTTRVLSVYARPRTGSGTITIRATNSEGMADWTVTYTTAAALGTPSFTDPTGDAQTWMVGDAITDITVPAANGNPTPTYAVEGSVPVGIAFNTTTRVLSGTPIATGSGTITIRATNSEGVADWTVTYTTAAALAAPSFTDPTGDAQTWTVGDAITDITVPAANGNPTATYAVEGSLPVGIAFNTTTRVLSGTPTATGSGTITIRATNSEGMADWTVTYTTAAALAAPSFTDPTGDAQTWTVGDAITDITVPAANGNPTPTYVVEGSLPVGISVQHHDSRPVRYADRNWLWHHHDPGDELGRRCLTGRLTYTTAAAQPPTVTIQTLSADVDPLMVVHLMATIMNPGGALTILWTANPSIGTIADDDH